jgi:hypothetical protein
MGKPRSKIQSQLDRATVAELYLKGWTQLQIAQHLEIDQSTVSRDLKCLQEQWKASAARDFDTDKAAELERLAMIEKEAWAAWQKSQTAKETSLSEELAVASGGRSRTSVKIEQKTGEVAYINALVKIVDIRAKLLGLFPSEKTSGGAGLALNDTQLDTLANLMREAKPNDSN